MDVEVVLKILEDTYPNAKCELNYNTPYELLIATILSAQCTDKRVNIVTQELFKHYNSPYDFCKIDINCLQEYIKSCGLYKVKSEKIKKTAQKIVENFDGKVPSNMKDLLSLDGVGRKTANVVLSNAFNVEAIAVDTHVFRVSNRIGIVSENNVQNTEKALMSVVKKKNWSKTHHLLIFHGRRICKAKKPNCLECPVNVYCKYYLSKGGHLR